MFLSKHDDLEEEKSKSLVWKKFFSSLICDSLSLVKNACQLKKKKNPYEQNKICMIIKFER